MASNLSVLDQCHKKNNRTLNFTLIGYGTYHSVREFSKFTKRKLLDHISNLDINLYDLQTLIKAEANSSLLMQHSKMTFRISSVAVTKEFLGFKNNCDTNKLYNFLYNYNPSNLLFPHSTYYTKKNLTALLQKLFDQQDYDSESTAYDCNIKISLNPINDQHAYVKIEYRINEVCIDSNFLPFLSWINLLIEELDAKFPNCFHSAYVSYNYPRMSIVHECMYEQCDLTLIHQSILGIEWMGYINNIILARLSTYDYKKLTELAQIKTLSNGVVYQVNADISAFDKIHRSKLMNALNSLIIPAFSCHNWANLCCQSWNISYAPKRIDVYYNPDDSNCPEIIFSHNYAIDQIQSILGLYSNQLISTFISKNS